MTHGQMVARLQEALDVINAPRPQVRSAAELELSARDTARRLGRVTAIVEDVLDGLTAGQDAA